MDNKIRNRTEEELNVRKKEFLKICDILDKVGITYFLNTGILLGAIRENDFINNLIVSFELSYLTFLVTIFIISPVLTNHFMQENIYVFNLLNAALIVSML